VRTLAVVICGALFALAAGCVMLVVFACFASAGAAMRLAGRTQEGRDARPGIEEDIG